jgi:hypothetical protein
LLDLLLMEQNLDRITKIPAKKGDRADHPGVAPSVRRRAFLVAAVACLLVACSSATSDTDGCKKDVDCATGRICNASGRCETPGAPRTDTTPSDGDASSTEPTREQLTCREWRLTRQGCDCKCGTSCLTYQSVDFCGHSCTSTNECLTYSRATFGPGYGFTPYCEDNFCVFAPNDGG